MDSGSSQSQHMGHLDKRVAMVPLGPYAGRAYGGQPPC